MIGSPGDLQVQCVAYALRERGLEPVLLSLSSYPAHGRISLLEGVPTVPGADLRCV